MAKTREYYREYYRQRRLEYIKILGGSCVKCGSSDGLEFDHIDPATKLFSVSSILTHSRAKVLPEILKCQLLCEMHHKEKNHTEGSYSRGGGQNKGSWKHGTQSAYRIGCRCDECKSGYSKERKAHYQRTGN